MMNTKFDFPQRKISDVLLVTWPASAGVFARHTSIGHAVLQQSIIIFNCENTQTVFQGWLEVVINSRSMVKCLFPIHTDSCFFNTTDDKHRDLPPPKKLQNCPFVSIHCHLVSGSILANRKQLLRATCVTCWQKSSCSEKTVTFDE